MSQQTLREVAQSVLLLAYGGKLKHDEMGFTEAQVGVWLSQERDRLMERDLENKGDSYQPDEAYFTSYKNEPLSWDSTANQHYIELPGGLPPFSLFNRGIRVRPVTGGGAMFIPTPDNYCNNNPHLAWMEGNWTWEYNNGTILFTNMPYDAVRFVNLQVIETKSTDLDKPLAIPSRHVAQCRDMVLDRMGMGRQDNVADGMDQRMMGGSK